MQRNAEVGLFTKPSNLIFLRRLIRPVERISQAPFIFVEFKTTEQTEKIQTPCNRSGYMLNLGQARTKNICHQGTKTRRILLLFLSVLVPLWREEKSFAIRTQNLQLRSYGISGWILS